MERPWQSDSFDSETIARDGTTEAPFADYLETIALLQQEVARLEQEIQLHDERQKESTSQDEAAVQNGVEVAGLQESIAGDLKEIERLNAELAGRDETIRLLLDELSHVEEAQEATRAEWEHLAGWVAELEHRVEGQDGDALRQLENRLVEEGHRADALQVKSEQNRRAWDSQRQIYQEEIARLQAALDDVATAPETHGASDNHVTENPGEDASTVEALQAENLRLRAAWQEMVERTTAAELSESLETKLAETQNERHQLRTQLEQFQDERRRERLEHEATVAELEVRLSQALLKHPQRPPAEKRSEGISPERDIELRVRALRECLLEVDQREKEERSQKHLISRLSRLWCRTGPR
jgi:hypothetical protein